MECLAIHCEGHHFSFRRRTRNAWLFATLSMYGKQIVTRLYADEEWWRRDLVDWGDSTKASTLMPCQHHDATHLASLLLHLAYLTWLWKCRGRNGFERFFRDPAKITVKWCNLLVLWLHVIVHDGLLRITNQSMSTTKDEWTFKCDVDLCIQLDAVAKLTPKVMM